MPLDGTALIEAAAGTGKTYNIQNIAARLIVEKDFKIDETVIVTFTEKATAELVERIRQVLTLLKNTLNNIRSSDEVQQQRADELIQHFKSCGISGELQMERITRALNDFDCNRISTIHGFCARILSENAFESSVAFRVRLEKDIAFYVDKLLGDFCRICRYSSQKLPGAEDLSVESLHDSVMTMLFRHGLQLDFRRKHFIKDQPGFYQNPEDIFKYQDDLKRQFLASADPVADLEVLLDRLNSIDKIPGNKYIADCIKGVQKLLDGDRSNDAFYETFKLLRSSRFYNRGKKSRSKNDPVDQFEFVNKHIGHGIFELAEDYCRCIEIDSKLFLQLRACDFVREKLAEWKERDNFQGFDDLLINVYKSLQNGELLKVLQNKFKAGIIDEFQDTDSLQYGIFRKIFIQRQDQVFFMVGDPRQAIYSFRGGDLATYMTARDECCAHGGVIYSLDVNFRSSAKLIGEFNRFFCHDSPLASGDITFGNAEVPEKPQPGIYCDGKELEHPLSLDIQLETAPAALYEKCAYEILCMLNSGQYTVPDAEDENGNIVCRPLEPGDIAVLAYSHYALDDVRQALEQYNIPVISERKSGIWNSLEASELAAVMTAVLENNQDSLLREALLTRICHRSMRDLDVFAEDSAGRMLAWRLDFMALEQCWYEHKTAAFMQKLFQIFNLKCELPGFTGGNRALTNYTQLGDLLVSAEMLNNLSPRGVLSYLQEKIRRAESDDESMEILDSDRSAVKLMTIHASKGLQFPVVFLPHLAAWYPLKRNNLKVYHQNRELVCNPDLTDPMGLKNAGIEELQELLRLVYVAVTRSCLFCRISWGKTSVGKKIIKNTPLHWLFNMRKQIDSSGEPLQKILYDFINIDGGFALPELDVPQEFIQPGIFPAAAFDYYELPPGKPPEKPPEAGYVANSWRMMSYSALPLGTLAENMLLAEADADSVFDRDEKSEISDTESLECGNNFKLTGGVWDLPAGAAIGNAWHKIMEVIDFTAPLQLETVENIMRYSGFSNPLHIRETHKMLQTLLDYTLPCGMKLKELPTERKRSEFEFTVSSPEGFSLPDLLNAAEPYMRETFGDNLQSAGSLDMQGGFFTGFVDLLFEYQGKFYIIDWKSNMLDREGAAFSGTRLARKMFEASYPMQYLCYMASLMLYLENLTGKTFDENLYEQYIGEVYYIFMRGMTLEKPAGVFTARPPYSVVRNIADVITCRQERRS